MRFWIVGTVVLVLAAVGGSFLGETLFGLDEEPQVTVSLGSEPPAPEPARPVTSVIESAPDTPESSETPDTTAATPVEDVSDVLADAAERSEGAAAQTPDQAVTQESPSELAAPEETVAVPESVPESAPDGAAGGGAETPARQSMAETTAAAVASAFDPKELIGLSAGAIRALLNEPHQSRADGPAEIWQYHNAKCYLDLFLYNRSGILEVTHVEARQPESAESVDAATCLLAILTAPSGG